MRDASDGGCVAQAVRVSYVRVCEVRMGERQIISNKRLLCNKRQELDLEINTKVCLFSEVNTKVCLLSFLARKCVFLIQSLVRGTEVCLFDFYARKCVLSDSLF